MNSVPDAIIQHILAKISNARDIACCSCVSKLWRDSVLFIPSLYFPRNAFDGAVAVSAADVAVGRMIAAAFRLEELIVYCPFSASALASWLALQSRSLRILELRLDGATEKAEALADGTISRIDCIGAAKELEVLRLWGAFVARPPSWGTFERLHTLEIVGATLRDEAVRDALRCCPNLTDLALLGCDGANSFSIELPRLERCRLDFLDPGNGSLFLSSPMLRALEIQGFGCVCVNKNHQLRSLCIAKNTGRVYEVDLGKLEGLEYLSLKGVQWSWNGISSLLNCASDVKQLVMKIEFSGDFDTLQPFPEIDLVEFFNNHSKLRSIEIHGALFAALCQKNNLRNLDTRFTIPCLEEVIITVRSPLNAEQKLNTLESLVRYSVKLQKMTIRVSQMKNCQETADDFFEEICKFKYTNYKIVHIQ